MKLAMIPLLSLCLATAPAQDRKPQDKLDQARLLIVGGEVQKAEALLRDLAQKGGFQDRGQAWKELAALYARQGRDGDRLACLDAMVELGGELAGWARVQREELQDEAASADVGLDPVRRLIGRLDEGSINDLRVKAAYESLSSLGVLMVPTLCAELDGLGPFGLQNAQKLLSRYPSRDLTAIAERYLADKDPNRQLFAANLLSDLPVTDRRRLVDKALDSDRDLVRYEAVRALSGLGDTQGRVLTEVEEAIAVASPQLRRRFVSLLDVFEPPYPEGLFPFLERCFGDVEADVRSAAVEAWVRLTPDDAGQQALTLFRRLDADGKAMLLQRALSKRRSWTALLLEALEQTGDEGMVRQIVYGLQRSKIRLGVDELRRLIAVEDPNAWSLVQQQLHAQPALIGRLPELVDLLDHPDQQRRLGAKQLLQRPQGHALLLARVRELPGLDFRLKDILEILQSSAGPAQVPDMLWLFNQVEHVDWENDNGQHYLPEVSAEIVRQFLPEHVPLLAQLLVVEGPAIPSTNHVKQRENLVYDSLRKDGLGEAELATVLDLARKGWSESRVKVVAQAFLWAVDAWAGDASEGLLCAALAAERQAVKQDPVRADLCRGLVACLDKMSGAASRELLLDLLADEGLAYAATQALFARRDLPEKAVVEAALRSAHSKELLQLVLQRKVAAEDEGLREVLVGQLTELPAGADVPDSLTTFLYSLPSTSRVEFCISLAAKQGLAGQSKLLQPVLQIIGDSKQPRNIDFLGRYLKHRDPSIRTLAVTGIGRTFDQQAIPYLLEALKDDVNQVSGEARIRLARLSQYLQEVEEWNQRLSGKGGAGGGARKPDDEDGRRDK